MLGFLRDSSCQLHHARELWNIWQEDYGWANLRRSMYKQCIPVVPEKGCGCLVAGKPLLPGDFL